MFAPTPAAQAPAGQPGAAAAEAAAQERVSPHSIPVSPSMLARSVLHLSGRKAVTGSCHHEHDEEVTQATKALVAWVQVAAEVQGIAADVVAGAHMQRPHAELRQRRAGAPAAGREAAAEGSPEGACYDASMKFVAGSELASYQRQAYSLCHRRLQFVLVNTMKECAFILLSLCK